MADKTLCAGPLAVIRALGLPSPLSSARRIGGGGLREYERDVLEGGVCDVLGRVGVAWL